MHSFVTLEQDVDGWHEIVFLSITLLNVLNQFVYIHKGTKKKLFSEYSSRHSLDENDDDHDVENDDDDNDECLIYLLRIVVLLYNSSL